MDNSITTQEDLQSESSSTVASTILVVKVKPLHLDMLDFICSNNLLFKFEWLSTWEMFANRYPKYDIEHPQNLKSIFINIILPNLYEYPISPEQEKYFDLLTKYAKLTRGTTGFNYKKNDKANEDIVKLSDDHKTAALLSNEKNWTFIKNLSSIDPNIQAVLSFICTSNVERKNSLLLSYDEIKERLLEIHNGRHNTAIDDFEQDVKSEVPFQKQLKDILDNLPEKLLERNQ